jgi:hypothetical protein
MFEDFFRFPKIPNPIFKNGIWKNREPKDRHDLIGCINTFFFDSQIFQIPFLKMGFENFGNDLFNFFLVYCHIFLVSTPGVDNFFTHVHIQNILLPPGLRILVMNVEVPTLLRKNLKSMANFLQRHDRRLSNIEIISMSSQVCDSDFGKFFGVVMPLHIIDLQLIVLLLFHVVPEGGWLLEYYLRAHAAYSVNRSFTRYLRIYANDPSDSNLTDLWKSIVDNCAVKFVGWILFSVMSVGSNGNTQSFYLTFVNHYLGLSRLGIDINSKYGYGVPLTSFDNMRAEQLNKCREEAKTKLSGPCVLWYDNFSKHRSHSVPTIYKSTFSECLWTGVTVNEYTGPQVDMGLKHNDDDNSLVHAMPDDLFQCKTIVQQNIEIEYGKGPSFFDDSMVAQYEVNNIPLKIDVKRFPEMAGVMDSPKNSTAYIHPMKLIKKNIGSNVGLISILHDIQSENNMDSNIGTGPDKYIVLNLDENIYWRVLKVLTTYSSDCCMSVVYTPSSS